MPNRQLCSVAMTSLVLLALTGCGSDSDNNPTADSATGDIVVETIISDTTGFIALVDGETAHNATNVLGAEVEPPTGVFSYGGAVYTSGFRKNSIVTKYVPHTDGSLVKEAEIATGESSMPSSIIFVNATKAYVSLMGSGELLVIDPTDLSIQKRIDLSDYALGEGDTNPEPAGGVIRDGKLYLGMGQVDSMQTFKCRAASVLIIDEASDAILNHITDDRTCLAELMPNQGLILDEQGDIYVNNTGSWGYYPDLKAGYLRIKQGEDVFDPDYFFSITDLDGLDVTGGKATYAYFDNYMGEGKTYTTLMIPGLTSNPPDYVNDKNFQPYVLDLYAQTATKLAMPASAGAAPSSMNYGGEVVYGLSTVNGTGLYRLNTDEPYVTTEGNPFFLINFQE